MRKTLAAMVLGLGLASFLAAQTSLIDARTAGMERMPGFFTLFRDAKEGKLWMAVDNVGREFLFTTSIAAGLGTYDVRLDRNQPGRARVVRFERVGPKLLLVQRNLGFRADTPDPDVRLNVEESFARSVLWGFDIAAENGTRLLVDATRFFLRDAGGAASALNRGGGTFAVDPARSVFHLPRTKSFPLNTEIEVTLTFAGSNPGSGVRQVTPEPESVTIRQHHTLARLPDDGFRPRVFDPRADYQIVRYMDFALPVGEPIVKRFIYRHRLEKKDPSAKLSDPVKPIVYYVDRGIPEPVRSAIVEGTGWWNEAFEALGYRNAFQVKILPADADPLDIRYNMVNWVDRATRGYCFGGSIVDPRTGEILKAQIVLDALHVRQDYLVAQAVAGDFGEGKDNSKVLLDLALASIRQIACHEVGHTLGPEHNFAGSVNDRASALDYPAPLIKIKPDGALDLSDAYVSGIGPWDKVLIAYGYQDFPAGADEARELRAILDRAFAGGLAFAASDDVPLPGSVAFNALPAAARWDNGSDPVAELEHVMKVRSIALSTFSERRIRIDEPLATLEEVLVPAYLYHRYQVDAAAGVLGGQYYAHRLRGDVQKDVEIVPAPAQRKALQVLLRTIEPEFLAIDRKILDKIPGRPAKYGQTPELFPGYTGQTFDPLAAAGTAADLTIRMILQPSRASRLVDFNGRDRNYPGLGEVIDPLFGATWKSALKSDAGQMLAGIRRMVDHVALVHLMRLAADEQNASPQARAVALLKIEELRAWLETQWSGEKDQDRKAHLFYGKELSAAFLKDPKGFKIPALLTPPAGGPI